MSDEPVIEERASLPAPSLPGPQVGEEYTDGEVTVTVTAVGEQYALAKDDAGIEAAYPIIPVAEGGSMAPVVPPPLVPLNTVLYEYHVEGSERGLWTNPAVASATGRTILLKPNGVWEEA